VHVVNELLEHGADIEAAEKYGKTPLHFASDHGHLAVVKDLLSANASNVATSILGKRKSGGANIEAKDSDGDTPLHKASLCNSLPVIKALLSGGANILAANNEGLFPIDHALPRGKAAVTKCLLRKLYATNRRLPLHGLVEDLTWIGNPYSRDVPPLRYALHRNVPDTDDTVKILEYLVAQDPALLSSRDQDGSLPLHVACRRGASFSVVQSLVNHHTASVESVTSDGDLPLATLPGVRDSRTV
jgi:ankyrin repeat protein